MRPGAVAARCLRREAGARGCRETVVCRRSTSRGHIRSQKRRELASRICDEYPARSGIYDNVLADTSASRRGKTLATRTTRFSTPPVAKHIYVDYASGAMASRPALDAVLRMLRDGDTLKITGLDRLGRAVLHVVTLGAELRERGAGRHVTGGRPAPTQSRAGRP
jgi:hypothetical protein